MTLAAVKAYFRTLIKPVPGGPAVGTPGNNRSAGVLLALDKLADGVQEEITLVQAQQPAAGTVVKPVPTAITGDWNATGTASTVYTWGVTPTAYHRLGIVYDAQGTAMLVELDVVAGTYKKLSGGEDLLDRQNTWTNQNTYQVGIRLQIPGKPGVILDYLPGGVQVIDEDTYDYGFLQGSDLYALDAVPAYVKYSDLTKAFQAVATTPGSRIRWVQGGLTSYSAWGAQRGSIVRPYATLQDAHDAALAGDVIYVLPGGNMTDSLGRPYYGQDYIQSKNVRLVLAPGVVIGGTIYMGAYFGDTPFNYSIQGGEFISRVLLCRQASAKSTLLIDGAKFTGALGGVQNFANHNVQGTHVDEFTLRNCQVLSNRPAGSNGAVRNNGRSNFGSCDIILDNTLCTSTDTPIITFSAVLPGRVTLRGTTELRPGPGQNAYQSLDTSEGFPAVPQDQWLVDERPTQGGSGGAGGTASLVTDTYTTPQAGAQTIAPADIAGLAQATQVTAVRVRDFSDASEPEAPALPTNTWSFDASTHTLTVLATAGIDGDEVLEVDYLTGSLASGGPGDYTAGTGIDITNKVISTKTVLRPALRVSNGVQNPSATAQPAPSAQFLKVTGYSQVERQVGSTPGTGWDAANQQYIVPVSGEYQVAAVGQLQPGVSSPSAVFYHMVYVNDVRTRDLFIQACPSNQEYYGGAGTTDLSLEAGDRVDIRYYHSGGDGSQLIQSNVRCTFSVRQLPS